MMGKPQAAPATALPSARAQGQTYRHPLGFSFWYPKGWRVQDTGQGLQLVPPDLKTDASGPRELYFVFGEAAPGIERADDPRVVAYFTQQIAALFPFLQRTGQPQAVATSAGEGSVLAWQGQNPAGKQVHARIYVVLVKGYGVALGAVAEKELLPTREPVLRRIFSSYGFGEAQRDPRLVGAWRHESHYSSGTFSSTTIHNLLLRPDGTFTTDSRLLASMEHRDSGGDPTGWTNADTGQDPGQNGRWGAANGKLVRMWNDGSYSELPYYVEGSPGQGKVLITLPSGKKQLWLQVR
jgi:hypothetical protein